MVKIVFPFQYNLTRVICVDEPDQQNSYNHNSTHQINIAALYIHIWYKVIT
jgi:hypothetical protein